MVAARDEIVACGGRSRRGRPYTGAGDAVDDDRLLDPGTEAAPICAMFVRPDRTRRGLEPFVSTMPDGVTLDAVAMERPVDEV